MCVEAYVLRKEISNAGNCHTINVYIRNHTHLIICHGTCIKVKVIIAIYVVPTIIGCY